MVHSLRRRHRYIFPPPVDNVLVTTGAVSERETIEAQVDEVRAIAGREIETVTADAGYAYARDGGLERRGIDPVIPVRKDPSRSRVPLRRFRYDARNDILKCPRGKILRLLRVTGRGRFFSSRTSDCTRCPLKGDCLPKTRINKEVVIPHDYPTLIRARRRHARWSEDDRRLYRRHLWRSEGYHGEAKTWHGLGRAIRRGLDRWCRKVGGKLENWRKLLIVKHSERRCAAAERSLRHETSYGIDVAQSIFR